MPPTVLGPVAIWGAGVASVAPLMVGEAVALSPPRPARPGLWVCDVLHTCPVPRVPRALRVPYVYSLPHVDPARGPIPLRARPLPGSLSSTPPARRTHVTTPWTERSHREPCPRKAGTTHFGRATARRGQGSSYSGLMLTTPFAGGGRYPSSCYRAGPFTAWGHSSDWNGPSAPSAPPRRRAPSCWRRGRIRSPCPH